MRRLLGRADSPARSPVYFALVMSTGLVAIACQLLGFRFTAAPLFWLNLGWALVGFPPPVKRLLPCRAGRPRPCKAQVNRVVDLGGSRKVFNRDFYEIYPAQA